MSELRVMVAGALGRMGQEVCRHVAAQPDMRLVGGVGLREAEGPGGVPVLASVTDGIERWQPRVIVDFTTPTAALGNARAALAAGVSPVVGTTGMTAQNLAEIERLAAAARLGAVVAPNFAIGAVLLMHLSKLAGRYFDYAEITELHHEKKVDSPSGTAVHTAREMLAARGRDFEHTVSSHEAVQGARGAAMGGIHLHSVRLPGLVAHQEVILGGLGQTLTLRHDSTSRECFMPGVLLAVREVVRLNGLVVGLDKLLKLE